MTGRLVRQILIRASKQGLDMAGMAVLGPAWPIMHAALTPVLDRLTEKLGGADPLASEAAANRAADAFEQDPRLEELLRTNLRLALDEALEPVLAGQQRVDAGLQTLLEISAGNTEALDEIRESVGSLARLVEQQTAVMRETRGFARQEADAAGAAGVSPDAWMTGDELKMEVQRAEVEAVGLIDGGRAAEAMEMLRDAAGQLAQALVETPSDAQLRALQGFLLKAMAQADMAAGDKAAAEHHLKRAEAIFSLILRDVTTRDAVASALTGLGNLLSIRGRQAGALEMYREAIRLDPGYGYAWHDLFGSLIALAGEGDLRPDELDEAWAGLVRAAPAYEGLEPEHLADLRVDYDRYRGRAAH